MDPRRNRSGPKAGKDLQKRVPESLLARLWQERAARQAGFRTAEGRRVKVLYPGRRGTEAGPDFRDALIHREGVGLVRGDVELHVGPRDWRSHGHGGDPRYNGVALHGVLTGGGESSTRLQSGAQAPVISLEGLLEAEPSSAPKTSGNESFIWSILAGRGYPRPRSRDEAQGLLARAGRERFLGMSAALAGLVAEEGEEEAIYQALMECLGYVENRAAFLELAQRAPCRSLVEAAKRVIPSERPALIEGLLLRAAGLGPGADDALDAATPPIRWRFFRVRPSNHPRRRVAGAAALLARFMEQGLPEGLAALAREGGFKPLRKGLLVPCPQAAPGGSPEEKRLTSLSPVRGAAPGGSPEEKRFTSLSPVRGAAPALIGGARAADIAVNAVLPFIYARGRGHARGLRRKDEAGAAEALDIFMAGPRLQSNRVTREMEAVLFPKEWLPLGDSLPRQQGLIHFHHLARGEG